MANEIVWASSTETGAPELTNATGSLDALLNAFLVTGWRTQTLTSLVVAGSVATATLAGHGYSDQRMVDIGGATPAGLNGRKLITVVNASTFTFDATGVASGTATGSITAKRSSLGWTRPYSSSNVSIYARSDVAATDMALRINDSGANGAAATYARVLQVWDYTDLNTYTYRAPTDAQVSGGLYWGKGANSSTPKPWVAVGDSRTLYLFTDGASYPGSSYNGTPQGIFMFGDIEPEASGDAFACLLTGGSSSGDSSTGFGYVLPLGSAGNNQLWLAAPFSGLGAPVTAQHIGMRSNQRLGGSGAPFPSPVGNGMRLQSPVLVSEQSLGFTHPIRGVARGMADPLANLALGELHLTLLSGVTGSARTWLMVGFNQGGGAGHAAFDVTGPWA